MTGGKTTGERLERIEATLEFIQGKVKEICDNHMHQIDGLEGKMVSMGKSIDDLAEKVNRLKRGWTAKDYIALIMSISALLAAIALYFPK